MLDEIDQGRPVRRHPTAQALAAVVARRALPRAPLEAAVDAWVNNREPDAAGAMAAAAAFVLDPAADLEAAAIAGRAWRSGVDAAARTAARRLSAAAFPAVAHAVLNARTGELARRLRLTWAIVRGDL